MADGLIANSEDVAQDFKKITGLDVPHLSVIHNPAYDDSIAGMMNMTTRHDWFEGGSIPIILHVGRLESQKNIPMLMDAFELVRDAHPCRLALIGEGSLKPELEARAESSRHAKDINFLGHRTNPFPYMKRASVFVLSSIWEGFGNVLVEALATGTPVVATNCPGGPREILADGKYGSLVPIDDVRAMAEAISSAINTPAAAEDLLQAAERFRADRIAGQYLEAFGLDRYTARN